MPTPQAKRVIVLGVDGLTPAILERLMETGQAPSFARIRERGTYRRLETSTPPQSPVAWSSIATGSNPGCHGVYDFIRRDPLRYLPELAILKPNPRNILGRRRQMFLPVRKGTPFWNLTSEAGIPTSVIRWPLTLPPEKVTGRMLSGLGVPDLKANLGRYTLYTTRQISPTERRRRDGDIVRLPSGVDVLQAKITGPERAQIPFKLCVDRRARAISLRLAGQDYRLGERQWSEWVRISFTIHFVRAVKGLCRFYLSCVSPDLDLYLSPIQVDPRDPAFIISQPDEYAPQLAGAIGDYHTLGMPEDTNALRDGCFDADAFLDLCDTVMAERERMLWYEIDQLDDGLLAFVFDTTDRIQHVFWAARDPKHPAYDEVFANRYGTVIEDYYRRVDDVLGNVLQSTDEETAIVVLSDHGFTSFRRAVHLNTWLVRNGFMALNHPATDPDQALLRNVDWSRTRAYALGFTSIYLNLKGREGRGIVSEGREADELKRRLIEKLSQLRDTVSGQRIVERVDASGALYAGPFVSDAPDLIVGFKPGYRVSWQTAIGASPDGLIEDNCGSWSGDHLVHPSYVPGVLFFNRRAPASEARVRDVAPTILDLLGLAKPPEMEGRSLVGR